MIRTVSYLFLAVLMFCSATISPSFAARGPMVGGQQGLDNINKLMTEVPWYTSMDFVRNKARSEDKPIFWVHMLGPMNGVT